MINTYEITRIKKEINDFNEENFKEYSIDIQNDIKKVVKYTFFLRSIADEENGNHYLKSMVSDLVFLIKSFKDNNYRYVHLNLRSIIEHALRFISDEPASGETRSNELWEKANKFLNANESQKLDISATKGAYKRACNYVHGNAKADMPIVSFFDETLNMKYEVNKTRSLLSNVLKVLHELVYILLAKCADLIDYVFHRKKTLLEYLINKKYVETLRSMTD
ncbi:hypothetical protein AV656_09365 [Bhargavaea cecembensis]|uniref:Uncharacterized protein n=1 Tax=Bhargavaea cecembensis TaxID=394098 RepID=A0A161RDN1_9BACL|nr:hypothetical protein [Bhargavaea cecembensis]KZE37732.1 hypothetical protein AV656_09365 [Bhargavaea cecembensis]